MSRMDWETSGWRGDSLVAAEGFHLSLGLAGDDDTVVAGGRLGCVHHLHPLVHFLLEVSDFGEGVDTVGGDVVAEVGSAGDSAVAEAGQDASEDVDDAGEAVALVGASLTAAADGGVANSRRGACRSSMMGVPSCSASHPAGMSAPRRWAMRILLTATELVAASKTKGASSPVGTAIAMGVGAEARLCAKGRQDLGRAAGHANANHVVLQGQHRVVGRHAEVAGVADGDHADADVAGLFDGDVHGLGGDDGAQATVGVDGGG